MRVEYNLSDADYRAIPLISVTQVCRRALSPSAWAYHNASEQEETPAMRLGSLFDAIVTKTGLEKFKIAEHKPGNSKAFQAEKQECEANNITLVSKEMWDKAQAMAESFQSHPLISQWLQSFRYQVSYIDQLNNLKGRLDIVMSDMFEKLVWDIKVCSGRFEYAVRDYGYDMQLAAYMRMAMTSDGGWLVISPEPPYEISIYRIRASTYEKAISVFDEYHEKLKDEIENPEKQQVRNVEVRFI